MNYDKQLSVKIPGSLLDEVLAYSVEKGLNLSGGVRKLLTAGLRDEESKRPDLEILYENIHAISAQVELLREEGHVRGIVNQQLSAFIAGNLDCVPQDRVEALIQEIVQHAESMAIEKERIFQFE